MRCIVAVENTRHSKFRSFRFDRSLFLCCTALAFAGVFICALPLLPPSSAQPLAGGGPAADVTPPSLRANPLDRITPVTDALLVRVPDGDWLTWRRGYDATGYSPLKAINRENVSHLRSVWAWSLPNGPNEATPLVHDGVLFVHAYGDKVQALDAATGDLLWQYSRQLPRDEQPSVKRAIAIYGDRLYVPTSDVHIVALDVKNGRVVWDQAIGNRKDGFGLTGGPLVARGKVMVGTIGRAAGGNVIVALDAATGKEAWRFHVIARPGEPGGDSWNGVPLDKRTGASVRIPGSYDLELNLAFFGPAQTYDTAPLRDPSGERAVTNDALYTDSTVALDLDTGRLVWYFQHQNNDQWDFDWAFERQIIKLPLFGENRTVVVTGGKQAIFDTLDAASGIYASSIDLGLQNVVTSIDPKTGAKNIDRKLVPGDGETKFICPHAGGARSWLPTSYDPAAKLIYVPLVESVRIRPTFSSAHGGFYFQAFSRSVSLPAAGYDYNSVWTPLLAGLSPARTAASFAAPTRSPRRRATESMEARQGRARWRSCGSRPSRTWSETAPGDRPASRRARCDPHRWRRDERGLACCLPSR